MDHLCYLYLVPGILGQVWTLIVLTPDICTLTYFVYAFTSVHCCLVFTCWERADLLFLFVLFNCDFVSFPFGILCQAWHLIVSISDICHLSYFD